MVPSSSPLGLGELDVLRYPAAMGRPTKAVEDVRRAKLVTAWCDMHEGIFVWPDGKDRGPGHTNKQEALRFAQYSDKYKAGYTIFERPDFKEQCEAEMRHRRHERRTMALPEPEQVKEMFRLVNLEILDRLESRPTMISDRDLITIRKELKDALEPKDSEGGTKQGRFGGIKVDKLIISLDGIIPEGNLEDIRKKFAGRVIEASAVDEDDLVSDS